jgi:hypothetical protein
LEALNSDICPSFSDEDRAGRPTVMTPEAVAKFIAYAEVNRYDFTYAEAAIALGIAGHATLRRWCRTTGWRQVCQRIVPLLTQYQMERRLAWAQYHRRSTWELWVDINEK